MQKRILAEETNRGVGLYIVKFSMMDVNENQILIRSRTSVRRYIFITLVGTTENQVLDLVDRRIKAVFSCKTILVRKHKIEYGKYRIGIHTEDASKHTYKERIKNLFPGFECQVLALGAWSQNLMDSQYQIKLDFFWRRKS